MGYSVERSGGGEVGDGTWAPIEGGGFFAADYNGVVYLGQVSVMGSRDAKRTDRDGSRKIPAPPSRYGSGWVIMIPGYVVQSR